MNKIYKKIFIINLFFLLTSLLHTQNISISASVDKNTISLNDQLLLQVTVSGDVSNLPSPTLPPIQGFSVYSSGRSQSISIVNNKISSSITFNYILTPKSVGKYTIDPITITYQNQVYKTNPITVEVIPGTTPVPTQPTQPSQVPSTETGKKVFVTASVDKKTAYVGEQITLSVKFYCATRLTSQPRYIPPETVGFLTEDLPPQQQYYTSIDRTRYLVTEIKTALFPTSPGKYYIGPAQVECSIEDFSIDDFFRDDFFSRFFSTGKTQVLKTNPIEITVLPLPQENKPVNFSGAVGDYKISAKLDKQQVQINQPVTLSITISGKGNIKTLSEPTLPEFTQFKKYQTLTSVNISKENYQVQGKKEFKVILNPRVSGRLVIPEIYWTYFSPTTKSYHTVKSDPLYLNVIPGTKEETISPVVTSEGVKIITTDIRHIKFTKIKRSGIPLHKNRIFVLLQFLPILSLISSYFYKKKVEKFNKDIRYARYSRAYKNFKSQYKKIKKTAFAPETIKEFYSKLFTIFMGYIADKLNLARAGLTIHSIKENLISKSVSNDIIEKIENLSNELNFAQFAPVKVSEKEFIEKVLKETENIVIELEKIL